MQDRLTVVISQHRGETTEHTALERRLAEALSSRRDLRTVLAPHLYDVKSDGATMEFLRSVSGDLAVLSWVYPRSAYWILRANGIEGQLGQTTSLPEEDIEESDAAAASRTIWCLDLRDHAEPETVLAELDAIVDQRGIAAELQATVAIRQQILPQEISEETGMRWYPVIDRDRCTDCLECLNFCLFGVYGMDDGDAILIEQPDACRAGCPACSRVCPEGAIMFPQHKDPAIAGDPELSLSGLQLDLSQIFGGADVDLSAASQLAQAERDRALKELERDTAKKDSTEPDLDRLVDDLDDMDL